MVHGPNQGQARVSIPVRGFVIALVALAALYGATYLASLGWAAYKEASCQGLFEIKHAFEACATAETPSMCLLGPPDIRAYSEAVKDLRSCPVEYREE